MSENLMTKTKNWSQIKDYNDRDCPISFTVTDICQSI